MSLVRATRQQIEKMLNKENPDGDLASQDLSGLDLSNLNLGEANLAGANLIGTNLIGTNLSKVNLSGANLTGVLYNFQTQWPQGFIESRNNAAQATLEGRLTAMLAELGVSSEELAGIRQSLRMAGLKPQQLRMELKEFVRSPAGLELFKDKESQTYRFLTLIEALTLTVVMQEKQA